jgi:hypothetical protein
VGCRFAARCELAAGECRAGPIPLIQLTEARATRCIRTTELAAAQEDKARQGTAQPGTQSQPRENGRANERATTA